MTVRDAGKGADVAGCQHPQTITTDVKAFHLMRMYGQKIALATVDIRKHMPRSEAIFADVRTLRMSFSPFYCR
jgi:hypothetical protein